jgi:hypothetical protein
MEPRLHFYLQEYGYDEPDVEVPRDVFEEAVVGGAATVSTLYNSLRWLLTEIDPALEVSATVPAQVYRPHLTVYRATICLRIV